MKRTIAELGTALLVCLVAPATALAGGEKVAVCHLDADTGTFHLITVSDSAFPAHVAHGDASPGDPVPGKEGYEFGPSCELLSPVFCPKEGTLTETLGQHSFCFWVNGASHGCTGASESWLWWFAWGVQWNYFYGGDQLEFCIDADCSAPYSCTVPY